MSKHTPGPWNLWVSADGAFQITAEKEAMLAQRAPWGHRAEEAIANAHLFYAAPDLYAALQAITAACEKDCGGAEMDDCDDDESVGASQDGDMALTFGMMRRARAAIAKAEGAK